MASLVGKIIAITGGASGMGLATAKALATKGVKAVCIGDYNTLNFDSVKNSITALNSTTKVELTKLDVTSSKSVEDWVSLIIAKYGGLDGAFNAAGIPQRPPVAQDKPAVLQESDEAWARVVDTNLTGLFYCCREEVKAMLKLPRTPRTIVNVASMAPFLHAGMMYAYGASKTGVLYLSENLAVDLRRYGIRVNAVCPGLTETPMKGEFMGGFPDATPPIPVIQPEDVSDVVTWLLSHEAPLLSGAHLPVGPGMP